MSLLPLLDRFQHTPASAQINCLWFVGPHDFGEYVDVLTIFPHIQQITLFEPHPAAASILRNRHGSDERIKIFELAVSDKSGIADFLITNNGLSSSLLPFSKHLDYFPEVKQIGTITVQTRAIPDLLSEFALCEPDLLIMDVQGAEVRIASTLPKSLRLRLKLIHSEASTIELYSESGTLQDLARVLNPDFELGEFLPLRQCPVHGDALFVRRPETRKAELNSAVCAEQVPRDWIAPC